MRDLIHKLLPTLVYGPITAAADNTPAQFDMRGYNSALLLIIAGVGGITFDGTNKIEVKVTHAGDDLAYTAVAAADVQLGALADATVGTGGIVKSYIAAHAAADIAAVGYIGGKRYMKVLADFSGTHGTGTPLTFILILGDPNIAPTAP